MEIKISRKILQNITMHQQKNQKIKVTFYFQ